MFRPVLLALLLSSSMGCASESTPAGTGGSGGAEAGSPLGVQAYLYTAEGEGYSLIQPGGTLELWAAPQGGHWARVGARVAGLETDTAELVARLVDPQTKQVVVEATRTAPMVATQDDPSLKQPDPTNMYNVVHLPLCPGDDGRALDGGEFWLELVVTELYGDFSTGSVSLPVVPKCQQPAGAEKDYCSCECGPGYVPGKCAGPTNG
jgi:hypothetical protein